MGQKTGGQSGMSRQSIEQHEGRKYLRTIYPAGDTSQSAIRIDVYAVLNAFNVTCPATQHAIKKLLAAGLRDKGSRMDDLTGAMAALNRAMDLESLARDLQHTMPTDPGAPQDLRTAKDFDPAAVAIKAPGTFAFESKFVNITLAEQTDGTFPGLNLGDRLVVRGVSSDKLELVQLTPEEDPGTPPDLR
jgi:hypothetical protein